MGNKKKGPTCTSPQECLCKCLPLPPHYPQPLLNPLPPPLPRQLPSHPPKQIYDRISDNTERRRRKKQAPRAPPDEHGHVEKGLTPKIAIRYSRTLTSCPLRRSRHQKKRKKNRAISLTPHALSHTPLARTLAPLSPLPISDLPLPPPPSPVVFCHVASSTYAESVLFFSRISKQQFSLCATVLFPFLLLPFAPAPTFPSLPSLAKQLHQKQKKIKQKPKLLPWETNKNKKKPKQNKTKQNKTKQNKTKQNKTKQNTEDTLPHADLHFHHHPFPHTPPQAPFLSLRAPSPPKRKKNNTPTWGFHSVPPCAKKKTTKQKTQKNIVCSFILAPFLASPAALPPHSLLFLPSLDPSAAASTTTHCPTLPRPSPRVASSPHAPLPPPHPSPFST